MIDEMKQLSKIITTQQRPSEANREQGQEEASTPSGGDITNIQTEAVNAESESEGQVGKGFLSRNIPTLNMKDGSLKLRGRGPLGRQAKKSMLSKALPDSHDLLEMYARRENLADFWRQGGTAKSKESWMVMSKRMVEYFKTVRISGPNERQPKLSGLARDAEASENGQAHYKGATTLPIDEIGW